MVRGVEYLISDLLPCLVDVGKWNIEIGICEQATNQHETDLYEEGNLV